MRIMLATLVAAGLAANCTANPLHFQFADDMQIGCPGDTDVERLAAREVQKYVSLVAGAELPIVAAAEGPGIVLVAGDADGVGELYSIDISARRVRIRGNCPVTLLFGVYDFLETHLGCRWLAGDEVGEQIPRRLRVRIPTSTRVERPSMPVRTFFLRREPEMWWALRNRLNGFYTREFVESLGTGTRRSLLYLPADQGGIHAWYRIVPAQKYFDKHPEYFAMIDGKRTPGSLRSGQICTTNPDVIRIVADAARAYFEQDPAARVFSIAPNDGYGWCECESCRALDEQLGGARNWAARNQPIVTDRLLYFANQVAERALDGLPNRELFIFAYVNYVVPPQVVKPREGVTVWLCHYRPACYAHAISDPDCPENALFLQHLRTWGQWPERMGIYAYTDKSMWEGLPRPIVRSMMADIELFDAAGIPRYVAQSAASNWGQMGALYWATTKKLWDTGADVERLLHRWCAGMFAESAQPMWRFVSVLEKAVADSGEHFNASPTVEGPKLFSARDLDEARECLRQAAALAASEKVSQRIETTRRAFEYGAGYLDFAHAYAAWNAAGERKQLQKALEAARALAGQGGRRGRDFKDRLPSLERELATGLVWVGFGKEETKGGRRCFNSDETGLGDGAAGWATFETVIKDRTAPHLLIATVWGKSGSFSPVVCSKGQGAGYSSGGVWTRLRLIEGDLSGKEQWDRLVFRIEPEWLDPESAKQRIGFGGGDSQTWIADVAIERAAE